MTTERQIRRAVKILLEHYGALDTSEVKEHLNEVLKFDEEDLISSTTRPGESMIQQRIGNVVSHQTNEIELYSEGFLIDKTSRPAMWYSDSGNTNEERISFENKISIKRNRLNTYSRHRYKKVNWEEVNERHTNLGRAGEEFIYQGELDLIREIRPDLIERVQHLSVLQGDGFGYDILSVDEYGNSKFIEVKTTTSSNPYAAFFMSINERSFFEENIDNNAFLYRVYDFDYLSGQGKVLAISAQELLSFYDFDPISFKVTYRG